MNVIMEVHFEYAHMNTVMRIVKEHQLNITKQDFKLDCRLQFEVRLSESDMILNVFKAYHELKVIQIND